MEKIIIDRINKLSDKLSKKFITIEKREDNGYNIYNYVHKDNCIDKDYIVVNKDFFALDKHQKLESNFDNFIKIYRYTKSDTIDFDIYRLYHRYNNKIEGTIQSYMIDQIALQEFLKSNKKIKTFKVINPKVNIKFDQWLHVGKIIKNKGYKLRKLVKLINQLSKRNCKNIEVFNDFTSEHLPILIEYSNGSLTRGGLVWNDSDKNKSKHKWTMHT